MSTADESDLPSLQHLHHQQKKRTHSPPCCPKPTFDEPILVRDTPPPHPSQQQHHHHQQPPPPQLSKKQQQGAAAAAAAAESPSTAIALDTKFLLHMKAQLETDIAILEAEHTILRIAKYPLRWNKHTGKRRSTAHPHPLRLVHTNTIYRAYAGRFRCDIHGGVWERPDYVFHCPTCLFDVCLQCVAQPCSRCAEGECCHTRIKIDLL